MSRPNSVEPEQAVHSTDAPVHEQLRSTRLRSSPAAMAFPVRFLRGRWPSILERNLSRFFWDDPRVVQDGAAPAEAFRKAMSAFWFQGTYKITGANRHPEADELLVAHVDSLADAHILDIGASDGSTSLDLIRRLPAFGRYTISDRFIEATLVERRGRSYFFDPDGECCLIVGRRVVLWPTMSRTVDLFSRPVRGGVNARREQRRPVLLLNPDVRERLRDDPRVTWQEHDIFRPWTGQPPDVVKVANLLRRLYFDDTTITRALRSLLLGMQDGGHLLIADNSRIPGMGPRAGLYRRVNGTFEVVARTTDVPEIDDLVTAVSSSARATPTTHRAAGGRP